MKPRNYKKLRAVIKEEVLDASEVCAKEKKMSMSRFVERALEREVKRLNKYDN